MQTLIAIAEEADFNVCQQFIWENIAKLPGPAPYVTTKRIRLKDSHTNIWWFSPVVRPKANNKAILTPYKDGQKKLMAKGSYNHGSRPSEHNISVNGFVTDNGGAIRGSTLAFDSEEDMVNSVIRMSNTQRDKAYYDWCTERELTMHPARMPVSLAKIFIEFLSDKGDLVLDPFGGSCTTGQAAEELGRKWIAVEMDKNYLEGAKGRFTRSLLKKR
jgi:site-specific DNA-methyltransferase (cytosine-N4-specific)